MLDIFSRYLVGWMLAMRKVAERLVADSICKQLAASPAEIALAD